MNNNFLLSRYKSIAATYFRNLFFEKSSNSKSEFNYRHFCTSVLIAILLFQNALFGLPIGNLDDVGKFKSNDKSEMSPSAAFTPGNLAIFQATSASGNNTTASIVEINTTTANQAAVQTLPIPDGASNPSGLRFSGSATSTGYLSRSNDGSLLAFNGANSTNTSGNANTLNPRAVGTFNPTGTYSLQTTYIGSSGNQTRGSTSLNNANWFIADQGGIYTNGTTGGSPTGNFRAIKSFGGTVYVGTQSSTSTAIQVSTVSAPSGGTVTGLPGLTNNNGFQDFFLISSGSNGASFDILYVLSTNEIAKYSLVGGSWVSNGIAATTFGGFGLAAAKSGNGANLFASTGTGATAANNIVRLTDTAGHNAAISITTANNVTLFTAPAGTTLKGVSLAPATPAPEINVTGNNISIVDGDTTPSTTDATDFGSVATGSNTSVTYTIQNTGTANLTLGTVTVTGANAGDFTVTAQPPATVLPNGSTTFSVQFAPSAVGLRNATINIPNNDADENPYDFAVQGTGTAVSAPEINVTGDSVTINDGDTTPSTADFTDFGNVESGSTTSRSYTIQNLGTANLTLGTVTVSGTNAGEFTVTSLPAETVAPNGSTTFSVQFAPTAAGLRTATINIPNNDADENPYDFSIQGTGTVTPTISENTASPRINLPANGAGNLSGVVGDPTDPGQMLGVDFTIADADTPIGSLTFTATSSNQTVVPNANLNPTGAGNARNLKITPAGVGYSTITISVSDGVTSASYTINYAASSPSNQTAATRWHTGKSDASTAIAIDANNMLVADDEDQTIRLFDRNQSGFPLNSFNFTSNLALTDLDGGVPREVDIEASAQSGNRIYWLASHSNSASGNNRPNRSRLFATDISGSGSGATLTYVGRYDNLKNDLIAWDSSNAHGLGANYFGLAASAATGVIPEAPDGSGWNIEGLVFAPDNSTAYIGFRAPIVPAANRTRALLVPVTNFANLVAGNPGSGPATFGAPIQLNLGGRGIREIKKNSSNEYLIVAGNAGTGANFRLYSWTGNPSDQPIARTEVLPSTLNPESIVDLPAGMNNLSPDGTVEVQLLSDNGDDIFYNDGVIAKELPNNEFKKFRSDILTISLAPTAASASISGRVLSNSGRGIFNAKVRITNAATGEIQNVQTNSFGYFSISELPVGSTFVVETQAKNYQFNQQIITLFEDIAELSIVANQ